MVVTMAVFALCTWVAGAVVLPHLISDHTDRWALAAASGVALAGLAGMGGYRYATAEAEEATDVHGPTKPPVAPHGERSISISGDQNGIASTGDNAVNLQGREKIE
jgi:hypothetical protein